MAPEQREGKPADARTDIYALGCVLYEMLTGTRVGPQLKPIRPRKLEQIVKRCLEEDPERRWQSAAELQRELSAVPSMASRAKSNATSVTRSSGGSAGGSSDSNRASSQVGRSTIVLADFANATDFMNALLKNGITVMKATAA